MNELLDGSSSGYEGICHKCGTVIKTNIQGNELGTHICGPREELEKKINDAGSAYIIKEHLDAEEISGYDIGIFREMFVAGALSPEAAEFHTHALRIEMVAKCAKIQEEQYRKGFAEEADKALKTLSCHVYTSREVKKLLKQCWKASHEYADQVIRIVSGLSNFDKPTLPDRKTWINQTLKKS